MKFLKYDHAKYILILDKERKCKELYLFQDLECYKNEIINFFLSHYTLY